MKNLSFLVLTVALAIGVVSCGGKDKSDGASNGFSSDPYKVTTVKGYLDVNQPVAIVGNTTYQISQASQNITLNAINTAHQQGIQTVMVNGMRMLRANITGSLGGMQGGYQQQGNYPQQGGMQGGYPQGGNVLNVQQAVVYR